MRRLAYILLFLAISVHAQQPEWLRRIQNPENEAHPWTFWYWMYGCVSEEGIERDLTAMKEAGIGGFYLMPIKGIEEGRQYHGDAQQLSDKWWTYMNRTFRIADSLGLQTGIHFSDGFALGGGPWITPAESMQKIVWTDTIVDGGKLNIILKRPESYMGYYEDVALYAYPATDFDRRKPMSSVSFPFSSAVDTSIVMSYAAPFTLRSVRIVTGGNNYQAHRFKIYASDDGMHYRFVKQLIPARQGWQNTDADATYSIPKTTARFFRFDWSPVGSEPGSEDLDAAKWKPNLKVADIQLSTSPVIDQYEGKSGLVWRIPMPDSSYDKECVPADKFIMLSSNLHGDRVQATLDTGKWHLLRMGHTSTGHTNATGGGAKGLECDKFSIAAIDKQFDNWFGRIYKHLPSEVAKRVLTRLHVDSWECGSQNWSSDFVESFRTTRGYDLMKWLPVYAGVPMESSMLSDKVLRDIRIVISDLTDNVFFLELSTLCHKYGCVLSSESVAPTMVSDAITHYTLSDRPMGEFWLNSPTHDKPNDMLDAVSGAHIYGKNIVQAEGFTEVRGTWDEHPAMLKTLLDRNFCIGMNKLFFHVNVLNPWLDRKPGMTLDGIGTFFQRDNTWWPEMKSFVDYITRCQSLLQYGNPVVDLAVYTGDEVPRRAVLPERLVTSLPGLFGTKIVERERIRMKNTGQPMEQSPVGVYHSANITDSRDWINAMHGYTYDSYNWDALFRSEVGKGCLLAPSGIIYRALVIPQPGPMNPQGLINQNRLNKLRELGLNIIDTIWRDSDLTRLGLERDAVLPDGIAYNHRTGDDADIYFLSNQRDVPISFLPSFRAKGTLYLFDALHNYVYQSDYITLPPYASVFAIISKKNDIPVSNKRPFGTVTGMQRSDDFINISPWSIRFLTTGKAILSDTLFDWSTSADNAVKYYSGHAEYTSVFKYHKKLTGNVLIDLGRVENIASVTVNGMDCGTVWMKPYVVDITKALHRGRNSIVIRVVNTWANALKGVSDGAPPFDGIWTNAKYRRADNTLLPAGLLGPLKIKYDEE